MAPTQRPSSAAAGWRHSFSGALGHATPCRASPVSAQSYGARDDDAARSTAPVHDLCAGCPDAYRSGTTPARSCALFRTCVSAPSSVPPCRFTSPIRRRTRREAACTWSAGSPAPVLSTVAAGQTRVSARRIGAHSAAVSSNARSTSRSSLVSSGRDPPFAPSPACCAGSG
jgi:hypothetical protein